jgi:hypothetical protein
LLFGVRGREGLVLAAEHLFGGGAVGGGFEEEAAFFFALAVG